MTPGEYRKGKGIEEGDSNVILETERLYLREMRRTIFFSV